MRRVSQNFYTLQEGKHARQVECAELVECNPGEPEWFSFVWVLLCLPAEIMKIWRGVQQLGQLGGHRPVLILISFSKTSLELERHKMRRWLLVERGDQDGSLAVLLAPVNFNMLPMGPVVQYNIKSNIRNLCVRISHETNLQWGLP